MHRVLRLFFAWALVIAIPVQGMAASAMSACGPSHPHAVQALAAAEPALADGLDADASDATACPQHHGKFGCSACAACCHALALPASFVLPALASAEELAPLATVATPSTQPPDGPDRPPRTALA